MCQTRRKPLIQALSSIEYKHRHVRRSHRSFPPRCGCLFKPTKVSDSTTDTQNISKDRTSLSDPHSHAPHRVNSLSELANNYTGTTEIGDTKVPGEALSGIGNRLPAEVETKNLGVLFGW